MYTASKVGKQRTKTSEKLSVKQKATGFLGHKLLFKWLLSIFIVILLLVVVVYASFQLSPWPNSLLIRYAFTQGSVKVSRELEKYVQPGVTQIENQHYQENDSDAYLDVFYPEHTATQLPTVVWVHGGAWVSGNKDDVDNYLNILSSHGYTVVSVNYTLAPEKQYPTPILQLNYALKYLQQNAKRLNVDDHHIVLAGDSAGSQIVAQMANVITSSAYAKRMSINSTLSASSLKGMILNCGAYDLRLADYSGQFGGLLHTVLWAYSGTQDFLHDPKLNNASVVNYVTSSFPPSFITAGNADPLEDQSIELAQKLQSLGVPTSTLFYPKDHQPRLQHEYQFDLDQQDGKHALQKIIDFLQRFGNV